MKDILLFSCVALVALTQAGLAAPVSETAATSEAAGWVGVVGRAFTQAGTNQVALSGGPVLTALSNAVLDSKAPNAALFGPLSKELAAQMPLQAFSSKSLADKIAAMDTAAEKARVTADRQADEALADVPSHWTMESASWAAHKLGALSVDGVYLSSEQRAKVGAALKEAQAFRQRHFDAIEAWYQQTPARIAEGAFDGAAHVVKAQDGWRVGERSPAEEPFSSYADAFRSRLAEIGSLPAGPGKTRALRELERNVQDAGVAAQAGSEGADLGALRQALSKTREVSEAVPYKNKGAVDAARKAYLSAPNKPLAFKHAVALLKDYDRASDRALFFAPVEPLSSRAHRQWRVVAGAVAGDREAGYPSFDELKQSNEEAYRHGGRRMVAGSIGAAAGMLSVAFGAPVHWLWLTIPGAILFLSSVTWLLWQSMARGRASGLGMDNGWKMEGWIGQLHLERARSAAARPPAKWPAPPSGA